jgi:hypothetical protein
VILPTGLSPILKLLVNTYNFYFLFFLNTVETLLFIKVEKKRYKPNVTNTNREQKLSLLSYGYHRAQEMEQNNKRTQQQQHATTTTLSTTAPERTQHASEKIGHRMQQQQHATATYSFYHRHFVPAWVLCTESIFANLISGAFHIFGTKLIERCLHG